MAAVEVALAPRAEMRALAWIRNVPSRPASAEAGMIAARVPNSLAAAEASGLQRSRGDPKDDARGPCGHAERITW